MKSCCQSRKVRGAYFQVVRRLAAAAAVVDQAAADIDRMLPSEPFQFPLPALPSHTVRSRSRVDTWWVDASADVRHEGRLDRVGRLRVDDEVFF